MKNIFDKNKSISPLPSKQTSILPDEDDADLQIFITPLTEESAAEEASEEEITEEQEEPLPANATTFYEEGGRFRVIILSDEIDDEDWRSVTMKCLETLNPSPFFGSIPKGTVFTVGCKLGWEAYAGWYLDEPRSPGFRDLIQ